MFTVGADDLLSCSIKCCAPNSCAYLILLHIKSVVVAIASKEIKLKLLGEAVNHNIRRGRYHQAVPTPTASST